MFKLYHEKTTMSPFNPFCCKRILGMFQNKKKLHIQGMILPGILNIPVKQTLKFDSEEEARLLKAEIERIRNSPGGFCQCESRGGGGTMIGICELK